MNFLKLTIAKWNYKDLLVHLKSIIMFFRNKIKLVGLRYKVFNLLCIMFLVCGNCALTSFFLFHLLMQVQPIIWRVTCLRASLRALAWKWFFFKCHNTIAIKNNVYSWCCYRSLSIEKVQWNYPCGIYLLKVPKRCVRSVQSKPYRYQKDVESF